MIAAHGRVLVTRLRPEAAAVLRTEHQEAVYHERARILTYGPGGAAGRIAVLAAGTSDLGVAEEAAVCAAWFGHRSSAVTTWGSPGSTGCSATCRRSAAPTWWWRSPDGRRPADGGRQPGAGAGGGRPHQRRLRGELRRPRRSPHHAERLRAGDRGGEHRQRLRRRGPRQPHRPRTPESDRSTSIASP